MIRDDVSRDRIVDRLPRAGLRGKAVAILVQNLPVPFDRRVWQEALTLRDAGMRVMVICPADERHPAGRFSLDGVSVLRYREVAEAVGASGYFREYGQSLYRMGALLRSELRHQRFDVIHLCNPPDLLFLVGLLGKSKGARIVFDQHDLGPELVRAKHMPASGVLSAIARIFERITYKSAVHVISTNDSYREKAIQRGRKSPESVTVVRSGPYIRWAARDPGRTDRWHKGHKYLLGYVGVMGRQEGIEYLLQCMQVLVHERDWDVHLALVGSGPDGRRLERRVHELNLVENVTFYGRLSDEDLRSVLFNSDVCVNPDEVNELNDLSTMNKIIEYMALGRPIVQFSVKEGRASAKDASLYASPNDARSFALCVERLLRSPLDAERMGERGRDRFREHLCWESQVPQLLGAYEAALRS